MANQAPSPHPPDVPNPMFRLTDLPAEIRTLIWEATLPPRRVFQLSFLGGPGPHDLFLRFSVHHPPPTTLAICPESRTIALRHGFFVPLDWDSSRNRTGEWFQPGTDMLYIDRGNRHLLKPTSANRQLCVPDLQRVRHVGIDWRAFSDDVPRFSSGFGNYSYWRRAIDMALRLMPKLETVNYILPQVRKPGGMAMGREPHGAMRYPPELLPLPVEARVPWTARRNLSEGMVVEGLVAADQEGRLVDRAPDVTVWGNIQRDMERDFLSCAEEKDITGEEERCREENALGEVPQILGWWLIRPSAMKTENFNTVGIVKFDY